MKTDKKVPKRPKLLPGLIILLACCIVISTINIGNAYAQENTVTLELHSKQPRDNTPFQVSNMFPGDKETQNYCVEVSYRENVTVYFHADIEKGYEKLAEVLKCSITLLTTGEILYAGLMKDMPESIACELSASGSDTKELLYEITTYLDTNVGNEYMGKSLSADFRWWVYEEETEASDFSKPPADTTASETETALQDTNTGDTNNLHAWIGITLGVAFALYCFFSIGKSKTEGGTV